MAKILLVDDDESLARTTADFLELNRFTLEVSLSGNDALDRVLEGSYDVIILDLNLPEVGGIEICKRFRAGGGTTPVLMLTGLDGVNDRVTGLDSGADDYLIKPFHMRELLARVNALLRRPTGEFKSDVLKIGDIVMDTRTHEVKKGDHVLKLIRVDYCLLEFFMRHPNQAFTQEQLLKRVWDADKEVGSDALRSSIRRLRKALDTDGASESRIISVHNVGYKLSPRE